MRRLLFPILLAAPLYCMAQEVKTESDSATSTQAAPLQAEFHVRYINGNTVYLDAGRNAGLTEGTKVVIKQLPSQSGEDKTLEPGILAELTVISVASVSAICEVNAAAREIAVGDLVVLPQMEVEKMIEKNTLGNTRIYPMVVSFSEGDPLDEEVRDAVPHPPLPEINQASGRFGFDISTIQGLGANNFTSTVYGMVVRTNITRIGGSHWNLDGYWRGQIRSAKTPSRASIQDLINRTYQMSMTYVNPQSHFLAGIGRLYLPWASSLEVLDGGYGGVQLNSKNILGIFGGSTPDPTAWNYNPRRKLTGIFLNTHGGSYEGLKYSSTIGGGVQLLQWNVDRPYFFSENDFVYKRVFSLYHAMQIDRPTANPGAAPISVGVGQSLLSLRMQVHPRVGLDLTHTYFRDIPTYDPALVGTGLLDKYLFQGISGGGRVEFPLHITGYITLGQSSTSTDTKSSWNTMYGASMARIWKTGVTVDIRYSKFDSAFASGNYRTLTISRDLGDRFRLNLQAGRQSYFSSLASKDNGDYFTNVFLETNLGSHYFFQTSFTTQRGGTQDYNQWTSTFGYRFNNRSHERRTGNANKP